MLSKEETQKALSRFIVSVVNQSKRLLTLKSKNKTKRLHKSIKGKSKANKNSFEASFEMEDYGKFQDRGVKGVGGTKADGTPWKLKKVSRNGIGLSRPYAFRNKMPPSSAFRTDKINRPVSMGQSIAIAKTVYHQGIETSEFFSRPFESAFKKLPNELVEAYSLDLENMIEFTLKK